MPHVEARIGALKSEIFLILSKDRRARYWEQVRDIVYRVRPCISKRELIGLFVTTACLDLQGVIDGVGRVLE